MRKQDIVIPLITPVGVRKDDFSHMLEKVLHQFKYKMIKIKISDLMIENEKKVHKESILEGIRNARTSEYDRILNP